MAFNIDPDKPLKPKILKFCAEYIACHRNGTQAYKRCFCAKTDAAANVGASQLLRNAKVKEEITRLEKAAIDKLGITNERILEEMANIAFAKQSDFLEFGTVKVPVRVDGKILVDKDGQVATDYRQMVQMKPSSQVDTRAIKSVSISPKGILSFELYSKDAMLVKLGQIKGLVKPDVNIVNNNSAQATSSADDYSYLSKEDIKTELEKIAAMEKGKK
jgi:phage terminase small subunit